MGIILESLSTHNNSFRLVVLVGKRVWIGLLLGLQLLAELSLTGSTFGRLLVHPTLGSFGSCFSFCV